MPGAKDAEENKSGRAPGPAGVHTLVEQIDSKVDKMLDVPTALPFTVTVKDKRELVYIEVIDCPCGGNN